MKNTDYIDISESLFIVRNLKKGNNSLLTEGTDNQQQTDAVPYTSNDEIMNNIIETAKSQFGADFSDSKNPMLYYPQDKDVTLSGVIRSLNDAKFQFRYKTSSGEGCFIWTSPLQLTKQTVHTLSVVYGVYENWKKELDGIDDLKPMSMHNAEESKPQQNIKPGDDLD